VNDISNRTLVFLTIIAIFFTLFGTATILGSLGQDIPLITGFGPTVQGNVSVTVAATTSIRLNGQNVSFGNGSAFGGVNLNTSSGVDNPSTFSDNPGEFQVENDGNVDVSLTINGSTATQFITTGTSPKYEWVPINATQSGAVEGGCDTALNVTKSNFSNTIAEVCSNFTFRDANDTLNVSIFLFLPTDTEPQTYVDLDVEFQGVQV